MKIRISSLLLVVILVFASSCSTYSDKELHNFDNQIKVYLKKQPEQFEKSDSGLYYFIEKEGEGENYIKLTDKVTFAYEGKLLNGEIFDRKTAADPITYDARVLIEGWKEVFAYLKKGGKAKVVIPPQLGYGDRNLEDIPENSVLVYDIEIIGVE